MPLLSHLLEENTASFGEYPFLFFEDSVYTNFETKTIVNRITEGLRALGIRENDRVIVCLPNCPEVIFSYQAITRTGAIIVPVMYVLHAKEIEYILRNSGAKAVITSSNTLPKIQEAIETIEEKPYLLVADAATHDNVTNLYDLPEKEGTLDEAGLQIREDAPAVILYTSGTTGKPKGVILTHKNLYSNAAASAQYETRGTTLGVLPLAHVYGLTVTNICYLLGSSIVVFSKFVTEDVFAAIEKHQIKGFSAVPAMIHAMIMDPHADRYNLESFQRVGSGSAPLPIALIQAFKKKFNADVYEGYGLSEAAPIVTSHREGMVLKPGSVGLPLKGVEIQIVDAQGKVLPAGVVGELIVRGDNVTPGYFQNEEESHKVLKEDWLYTGDMAKVDEDGYLFIVDRKKDLIIRGGFNIYPRDLEELLSSHPSVSEAAVVGVPDERMGEEVLAFVVKKEGAETSEEAFIQFCQAHLAKNKTPRRILFLDTLPRNGVGKVLKTKLRELGTGVDLFGTDASLNNQKG